MEKKTWFETLSDTQLLGLIIGWGLTEISGLFKSKKENRKDLAMALLPLKLQAFQEIYNMLEDIESYFDSFIKESEFKETREVSLFAPLEKYTELVTLFNKQKIYFDKKLNLNINEFISGISSSLNFPIYYSQKDSFFTEDTIIDFCRNTVKKSKELKEKIRKSMRLNSLDTFGV